jgi:hypothetical protein
LIPVRPLDLVALADPNNPIFGTGEDEDSEKEDGKDGKDSKGDKRGEGAQLTNGDCFPDSAPANASNLARTCLSLAQSAPGMAFTPNDYHGMPDECKPLVKAKCR